MKKEEIRKRREVFGERVYGLRQRLDACLLGKTGADGIFSELLELSREEKELLQEAVYDYRHLKLKTEAPECQLSLLLENPEKRKEANELSKEQSLALEELVSEKRMEELLTANEWMEGVTAAFHSCEDSWVCGCEDGTVVFFTVEAGKPAVREMLKIFPQGVLSLEPLKREGEIKSGEAYFLVTGEGGRICILSQEEKLWEWQIEEEAFFASASVAGTAIILGESGGIYYLEENRGIWELYPKPVLTEIFAERVVPAEKNTYLFKDVENQIYKLWVKRITTPEELWKQPML